MAIAFLHEASGMIQEQYDQILATVQRSSRKDEGIIFHVAGPIEGG